MDYCLRQSKKFKKVEVEYGRPIEEIEEELEEPKEELEVGEKNTQSEDTG